MPTPSAEPHSQLQTSPTLRPAVPAAGQTNQDCQRDWAVLFLFSSRRNLTIAISRSFMCHLGHSTVNASKYLFIIPQSIPTPKTYLKKPAVHRIKRKMPTVKRYVQSPDRQSKATSFNRQKSVKQSAGSSFRGQQLQIRLSRSLSAFLDKKNREISDKRKRPYKPLHPPNNTSRFPMPEVAAEKRYHR